MTMHKLQEKLARMYQDLNDVCLELWKRRFEGDWLLAERALDEVGQICNGFLDEAALGRFRYSSDDMDRPEPGLTGMEMRHPHLFPTDKNVIEHPQKPPKKMPKRAEGLQDHLAHIRA